MSARGWSSLSWLGLLAVGVAVVALRVRLENAPSLPAVRTLPAGWTVSLDGENLMAIALQGELIWAGGARGLRAIHRARGAPVPLPIEQELRLVRDVRVDGTGRVWVAHGDGVTVREGTSWRTPLAGPARAVAIDGTRVWAATEAGLFASVDGAAFQEIEPPAALSSHTPDVIFVDQFHGVWLGVSSATAPGLYRFAGGRFAHFGAADGLPHPSVQAVADGPDGSLLFATGALGRGGLARAALAADGADLVRDRGGRRFTHRGRRDGLAADQVRSVYLDRAGWLWVGSESDGCAVHNGRGWRVLTTAHGLPAWEVKQVLQDNDGHLWLATAAGLVRIEDHRALDPSFSEARP